MTSNISGTSYIGTHGGEHVQLQIGSMGTNRDLSQFDLTAPVPKTMEEMRKTHPELYQEILLQVFETMNVLTKRLLKESEESWKKNWKEV